MSRYENPQTEAFRATLDRLPDEIALAIGLHVYTPKTVKSGFTCVCGWSVREAFARTLGVAAESSEAYTKLVDGPAIYAMCQQRFGGSLERWADLYFGVCSSNARLIEEALFDRVMAAATATPEKRSSRSPKAAKSQKSGAK